MTSQRLEVHDVNQNYISRTAAVAVGAWVVAGALLITAWMLVVVPGHRPQGLVGVVGITAIVAAAIGAVSQIRLYAIRTCALIRAVHGVELEESQIRPVR